MYDIERDKYIEFVDSQFRYHTSSLKWSPKGNYVIATSYDNSLSIFEYTNPNKKSSKYMSSYGSLSFDVYERHDIFKEIYVIENVHPFESYRWFSEKEFFYKSTENDELYLFDISTKHGRPIEEKYIKEKLQETEERQSAKFQYYFKEVPLEKPLGIYILYRKNLITGQEEELPFFTVKYIF
jgi:WD40 repeat protein